MKVGVAVGFTKPLFSPEGIHANPKTAIATVWISANCREEPMKDFTASYQT